MHVEVGAEGATRVLPIRLTIDASDRVLAARVDMGVPEVGREQETVRGLSGLRVSMGTGLTILVASELLGGDRGLGFIILDASSFFRTTYVFAGIILIGFIGLLSDRGIAFLARRIVHWEGRR